MMRRRKLLIVLGTGVLTAPLACFAQQQRPKVARIGLLIAGSLSAVRREALVAGLRERGLVEGRNMIIEYRGAEANYERLPALAAELVQMKVDVIVAASSPVIRAAQQATTTIPIVMVRAGDPVGFGFVASLSRPERNITGLSNVATDLSSKHVELLRDAVPKLSRAGVLVNPANPIHAPLLKPLQGAEKIGGVKIIPIRAGSASDIDVAFGAMKRERAEALIVLGDPFFGSQGRRIAELAAQQRLPTMFANRGVLLQAGGLMS